MRFLSFIPCGGFFRAAAVLTAGSALAQLLPMLASPLLARLYTPGELGTYAIFISTLNLTGQLACFKYDLALTVASGERQASGLLRLSLFLCGGVSLLLLSLGLFARPISSYFSASSYKWVWLIAPATFAVGVHAAFVGANLKLQNTGAICLANAIRGAVLALGQPLLSFWGAEGICLGHVLAYGAACLPLCQGTCSLLRENGEGQKQKLFTLLRDNRSFPLYTLPGSLLGNLAYSLAGYGFARLFSAGALGNYSLAVRLLSAPISLISAPVGQVYLSRSGEKGLLSKVTRGLFPLGMLGYGALFLLAGPAVRLLFGPGWEPAILYLRLLLPLYLVRFITVPTSTAAIAQGRQKATALWQGGMLLLAAVPLGVPGIGPAMFLFFHAVLLSMGYLGFYCYCYGLEQPSAKGV